MNEIENTVTAPIDESIIITQETTESLSQIQDHDVVETRIPKLKLSMPTHEMPKLDGLGIFDVASICDEALAQPSHIHFPKTTCDPLNVLLTQLGQEFYVEIAKDPPRWMKRAILLNSKIAFKEAAIHMVGCWPKWPWPSPKGSLEEQVQRMINKKASLLRTKSRDIDRDLLLSNIEHHKFGAVAPVTLVEDVEASLVVSSWSSWFRNAIWEIQDSQTGEVDPTQVGAIYRKISSKSEYLRPEELRMSLVAPKLIFHIIKKGSARTLAYSKMRRRR